MIIKHFNLFILLALPMLGVCQKTVTGSVKAVNGDPLADINAMGDMAFVMKDGRIVEFGVPHDLIANSGGAFSSLVAATGTEAAAELRAIALASSRKMGKLSK